MKILDSLKRIASQINGIMNRRQKLSAVWLFVIMIITSLLELLGISAILPFVKAITSPEKAMKNKYVAKICMILGIQEASELFIVLGIILAFIYISKNLLLIYSAYVQHDFATKIQMQLSVRMLKSYMNRPYVFFTNTDSAEIIRGCSADVNSVYTIIIMLVDIITQCLTVGVIGAFLIYTDPFISLVTLLLMLLVSIGIMFVFKPTFKRCGKRAQELTAETTKALYESINGIKEIMVMQRRELFIDKYYKAYDESRIINRKYGTLNAMPDRIVEGVCITGIIGIIIVRLSINMDNLISFIPTLSAFALGAFKILPSIGKIASRMNAVIFSMPGLEKVYENIAEINDFEKENAIESSKERASSDKGKICFDETLKINHVFWEYEAARKPVLTDASLIIHKGESIGIIGSSGAGKTTLSDIILGLMKPQKGQVIMDETDVYSIPYDWAHIVGYVPQSVYLTNDSIRANVAFGISENDIDDERIWDALKQAQLYDFVKELPSTIDTIVGERGIRFSGGQRQRIAIARALYNAPEIIVLDEATASLDNETENAVMEAIDSLQGQVTLIIVAHRLTTIRNCNHIFEVVDGKVVERDKASVFEDI